MKETDGFKTSIFDKITKRKHILYYGVTNRETPIKIEYATNKVHMPLLKKEDITKHLMKIKDRTKIGWIHIGAIQIMVKATFREGIDTPLDLVLMDNRLQDKQDAIFGMIQGNLSYQKRIFNVYPKMGIPITDKNINYTLSLLQDFKKGSQFMQAGSIPYSITYIISYALSNTHHSETFEEREFIELPKIFEQASKKYLPTLAIGDRQNDH